MAEDTIKDEEYAPITQELREYLKKAWLWLPKGRVEEMLAECDNIDALHKALEEQNAKLHEKVLNQRKQLAEVQEAIERRNNGVLKRRWQKKMDALKNENEEMRDFNYRVREAVRRHEDLTLWGTDFTELPVDADGVPIHVGDKLVWTDGGTERITVAGIGRADRNLLFYLIDGGAEWTAAGNKRHYHEPTVADVLREFADGIKNQNADFTELAIAEYAKRLQLMDGDAE